MVGASRPGGTGLPCHGTVTVLPAVKRMGRFSFRFKLEIIRDHLPKTIFVFYSFDIRWTNDFCKNENYQRQSNNAGIRKNRIINKNITC